MDDLTHELKAGARILHRQAQARDTDALRRLHTLPELRDLDGAEIADRVRRRHCLAVIARELGFDGWPQAAAVLRGDRDATDFGTLLYPSGAAAHWNIWSASYDEAKTIRAQHGGYLLAYKRHFFIVDRHFIETLGLDPEDPDWEAIGRDWARPKKVEARGRLYAKLIRQRSEPPKVPCLSPA
ncbi:MAG: hypothetical protein V3T72_09870 [Thermoanaerobaculia bacterium]